ncbi:MAG: HAD-IIIA family hydrolase [Chloroherpetonaceae bacterium]|nr:HAD-IIIA family hydrolase [Chloroherpetonaceae bacterium]MCS7212365.1 HAD-IIIA family hydrolase [Chloroherpetonaceae bacterium]MDW8018568.1 HAD-IIIA family hydrolase [Chloroherpetonaceae bacterium]MDW8467332.1 HAD-IIIA family hydrolase [Chloroherpetonaceae bacterium]
MPKKLSLAEQRRRAMRIKLVLTDSDGVLTDTGVYYSERGEELKRFSIRDGMGVERLRKLARIETAIITGENSGSVRKRAEKLRMPFLYLGVKDKRAHLEVILRETSLSLENLAYIGDDMNDLDILQTIGEVSLTAAPSDAMPAIQAVAHYICKARGGYGAFRDFAEHILQLRGITS